MIENIRGLIEAHKGLEREVYLDNENSPMVPDEVLEAMLPYFNRRGYGNPSITHKPGWEALEAIMESSQTLAKYIGCREPSRLSFTPGETESNNLALIGTALARRGDGGKIVISEIEPLSILNTAGYVAKIFGFKVERVPVDGEGFIYLDRLADAVDKDTILVSISMVNHEIGTVQPLKEAIDIIRDRNPEALIHSDLSDAFTKIPLDVDSLGIDLATLSSYKILGPRGVGALYVREGVVIERILEGQIGTQSLWPGIENTPLIVGFAKAAELAFENFGDNVKRMRRLRDRLIDGILDGVDKVRLNGPRGDRRAPDNINISFLGCEGEALTLELSLNGVYVSSGSACTRRMLQPSHVLIGIGVRHSEAHGSILMKVTRYHSDEDIDYVLEVVPKAVKRIRKIAGGSALT